MWACYALDTGLAVGGVLAGRRKWKCRVPRNRAAAGGVVVVVDCRRRRGRFHGCGFTRSFCLRPSIPTARVTQVLALAASMPDAEPAVWLRRAVSQPGEGR